VIEKASEEGVRKIREVWDMKKWNNKEVDAKIKKNAANS
jgi:hypothetical protein